jgi:flagellar biosynthesis anti-sigma factor FlgM
MRIDLYSSAAAAAATNQGVKASNDLAHKTSVAQNTPTEDTTSLTSSSDSVNSLTQAALQTIPSRADRVAALKQSVNSAQYQLDAAKIAESLSNSDV